MSMLIFDLDDTLFNTSYELRRIIRQDYGVDITHNEYLDGKNCKGLSKPIIESGQYMTTVPLFDELITLPHLIQRFRRHGGVVGVCTHRGYHKNAQELTQGSFEKHGLIFDFQHFLDPKVDECKITYLNDKYGVGNYQLFDDRPKGASVEPITESNVYLVNRPYNRHVDAAVRIHVYQIPNIVRSMALILERDK